MQLTRVLVNKLQEKSHLSLRLEDNQGGTLDASTRACRYARCRFKFGILQLGSLPLVTGRELHSGGALWGDGSDGQ